MNNVFNRINNLIEIANVEDLEIIQDSLDSFPKYIDSITKMEVGARIARYKCNTQHELVEEIQRLDRNRYYCHNAAIVSVKVLNRLCDLYKVEKIFKGDIESRQEVADFAKEVVDIYYSIRKK